METKDWIILILPIISNGIILVIFQKLIVDKYIKHRLLKDEIVKSFMDKLKELLELMIQSNFDSVIDGDSVNDNIAKMQSKIVDIVKYYYTNNYDLKKFNIEFETFNNNWMIFQKTCNIYALQDFTMEKKMDLGNKMQSVFDSLQELVNVVRKKY